VLEHPKVRDYRQAAWIDADMLFNIFQPADLFAGVPLERIGAVDSFMDPTPEGNREAMERVCRWSGGTLSTPELIYRQYDPAATPPSRVLNAGVLVASPALHGPVFRQIYDQYEQNEGSPFYENVPLSYELVRRDLVHWMDPKFNHLWNWSKFLDYPFLVDNSPRPLRDKVLRRMATWTGNRYEVRIARLCATAALLNCHCLHFAGCGHEIALVDQRAAAAGRVPNLGLA